MVWFFAKMKVVLVIRKLNSFRWPSRPFGNIGTKPKALAKNQLKNWERFLRDKWALESLFLQGACGDPGRIRESGNYKVD